MVLPDPGGPISTSAPARSTGGVAGLDAPRQQRVGHALQLLVGRCRPAGPPRSAAPACDRVRGAARSASARALSGSRRVKSFQASAATCCSSSARRLRSSSRDRADPRRVSAARTSQLRRVGERSASPPRGTAGCDFGACAGARRRLRGLALAVPAARLRSSCLSAAVSASVPCPAASSRSTAAQTSTPSAVRAGAQDDRIRALLLADGTQRTRMSAAR